MWKKKEKTDILQSRCGKINLESHSRWFSLNYSLQLLKLQKLVRFPTFLSAKFLKEHSYGTPRNHFILWKMFYYLAKRKFFFKKIQTPKAIINKIKSNIRKQGSQTLYLGHIYYVSLHFPHDSKQEKVEIMT